MDVRVIPFKRRPLYLKATKIPPKSDGVEIPLARPMAWVSDSLLALLREVAVRSYVLHLYLLAN
jgi:hypothetical protein